MTRVAIAGAGIAGLTLAVALARKGIQSDVYERRPVLSEIGAGIQLSPNATACLDRLGLLAPIAARAERPEAVRTVSSGSGRTIARVPLGAAAQQRFGAPYLVLARPDLLAVLAEAAAREPAITLRLGAQVTGMAEERQQLAIETSAGRVTADVLVGADGVESVVRTRILGGAASVDTGITAYRATIPTAGLDRALLAETWLWLAPNAHLVHYAMGGLLNLVAVVKEAEREVAGEEWDAEATAEAVRREFARFAEPARSLFAAAEASASGWRRWPLRTVDPHAQWRRGRVVVLGDAAHAMQPFLAQGAAMAIEDAMVLADHLAADDNPRQAIAAFAGSRRQRVAKAAGEARRNGGIYHLGGAAALARDTAMRLMGENGLLSRLDWLYGWKAEG